ncbi:MAG: type IV toxin-antitoxin system AbiEi family antitoxin domain-containing protein [Candidatus Njordarchaeia archaeon]
MRYGIYKWMQTLESLKTQGVKYTNLNALSALTGIKKESLRVALWRLEKRGLIYKIGKWYVLPPATIEDIAKIAQIPCYISLEWVLFKNNVIDQAPYTCTCVTTKKPKKIQTKMGTIEYKHIKKQLFFGYNEKLEAYPEKALLDLIYYKRHKDKTINTEEIDREKLEKYAKKYPKTVQKEAKKLISQKI